jgi:syntaxin-binding protein 1
VPCYFSLVTTDITTEGIRRVVRERILGEMLGSVNDQTGGGWKVLVMDAFTTKITSAAVRMSDILDAGERLQGLQDC